MAKTTLENLLIPGGRFISGSLTEKSAKDQKGAPIPADKQRYWFGVAVPKTAPGVNELIGKLWQMAATDYAQVPLVMQQINMGLGATAFAWKIDDGDVPQVDRNTGQYRENPEYRKGCFIFGFGTMFEFGACDENNADIDRAAIKRGDYVDVMFNSTINENIDATAGIYLNPVAVRRLAFGEPISAGQTKASSAFAGHAPTFAPPPGASTMPQAGSPMPGMGMPSVPSIAPPPAAPAAFPPAGWTAHPSAPGYYYQGHEVLTEADLRARFAPLAAPPVPVPPVMVPAGGTGMPGMPAVGGIASPSSYPAILTGGMPGLVK